MGEYLTTTKGIDIKLGTCEHLMYVRYAEVEQEAKTNRAAREYLDPAATWLYRFPYPWLDQDAIECANERQPFDYVTFTSEVVKGIDHETKCVSMSVDGAYNVNVFVPCILSPDFDKLNLKTSQNGPSYPIRIIGERVRPDVQGLYTVFACGYCDHWFSLNAQEIEQVRADFLKHFIRRGEMSESVRKDWEEAARRMKPRIAK